MPTYCERVGIATGPRTESVALALTPSTLAVTAVKPARMGVTLPCASTVATVGSATVQVTVLWSTLLPPESFS